MNWIQGSWSDVSSPLFFCPGKLIHAAYHVAELAEEFLTIPQDVDGEENEAFVVCLGQWRETVADVFANQ